MCGLVISTRTSKSSDSATERRARGKHQFAVAYTHWWNGAEAMVMILFSSIRMVSVMKKYVEVFRRSTAFFLRLNLLCKELRKLRLTRALTSKLRAGPAEKWI